MSQAHQMAIRRQPARETLRADQRPRRATGLELESVSTPGWATAMGLASSVNLAALQRTAGNQAVLALLRRFETPAATRPSQVGRSVVVQREIDVGIAQVDLDPGTNTIANSHFSTTNRPAGSIKGEEGSHTTAWVVTLEGIRSAIQGKTLAAAITAVDAIYTEAKGLPGALPARTNALSIERQAVLQEAKTLTDQAKTDATANATLENLQSFIGCLMAYRNSLPLTAAKRGSPANSAAESNNIAIVKDPFNNSPATLRQAIFGLLDKKAAEDYFANAEFTDDSDDGGMQDVSLDHPGAIDTEQPLKRVEDIVEQHLKWIKALYPAAYTRAAITRQHVVAALSGGGVDLGDLTTFSTGATNVIPAAAAHPAAPAATLPNDRFATEVIIDQNTREVTGVWVHGRPEGVFGSSDKKHVTAWTVFFNAVVTTTVDRPLNDAIREMKALFADAKRLPGAQDEQVQATSSATQARFTTALANATTAEAAATAAQANPDVNVKQSALQTLIHTYLAYRNAMPLSAAIIPSQVSTTGGKSEGNSIKILDAFEASGSRYSSKDEQRNAQKAIWALLDFGGLKVGLDDPGARAGYALATNAHGVEYHANVPGIATAQKQAIRVTNVIVQHLKTVMSAYPRTVNRLKAKLSAKLADVLEEKLGLRLEQTARRIRTAMRW